MQSVTGCYYLSSDIKISLGLSNALNLHKPSKPVSERVRARRGLKGMSSEQKRLLRSAMVIQEQVVGKENTSFGTCTIPKLDTESHYLLVSKWAEIVNRFIQALERKLNKKGIQGNIIAVTEIQEKRFKNHGMVAPHLHLTFPGRNDRYSQWAISVKEFTALWQNILANAIGFKPDCKAATNIQQVKVSVKRYLSKYMSKGGEILANIIQAGLGEYIPTSWFYCTRELKQAARRSIEKLDNKVAEYIYDNREYLKSIGILSWFHVVTLEHTDYQTGFEYSRNVGLVGGFNDQIPIEAILKSIHSLMNGA